MLCRALAVLTLSLSGCVSGSVGPAGQASLEAAVVPRCEQLPSVAIYSIRRHGGRTTQFDFSSGPISLRPGHYVLEVACATTYDEASGRCTDWVHLDAADRHEIHIEAGRRYSVRCVRTAEAFTYSHVSSAL